jgi:hypothetical protein
VILRPRDAARNSSRGPAAPPRRALREGPSDRWALWFLLLVHAALEAALAVAAWTFVKSMPSLPLTASQKAMFEIGLGAALIVFGARGFLLFRRLRRTPPSTRP